MAVLNTMKTGDSEDLMFGARDLAAKSIFDELMLNAISLTTLKHFVFPSRQDHEQIHQGHGHHRRHVASGAV